METARMEQMKARVICQECGDRLLVCDCSTCQQVMVHTDQACCFSAGELVCIEYSGAMTMSLPPQVSASRIWRIGCC